MTLDTNWPLGLIRAWAYAVPDMRCLVYPTPASRPPCRHRRLLAAVPATRPSNPSGSEDFLALRGHQLADPPRHVAWKTAARLGADAPLMTKQYADPAAQTVWLDWDALPAAMPVEERLSWLTRWVLDAHAAGLSWGLRLPGSTTRAGWRRRPPARLPAPSGTAWRRVSHPRITASQTWWLLAAALTALLPLTPHVPPWLSRHGPGSAGRTRPAQLDTAQAAGTRLADSAHLRRQRRRPCPVQDAVRAEPRRGTAHHCFLP